MSSGLPRALVLENPPSSAGDVGSVSGGETKIPHAMEQLSLHASTKEPERPDKEPTQP